MASVCFFDSPKRSVRREAASASVCEERMMCDDLVDIVECDHQALEDVRAFLGLRQLVARPAHDDVFLVRDVVVQHLLEREHARHAVHERQHDGAEAHLQLRVLVQLVEHHLRNGVLLEVDDDVDAVAVGAVVDVR